MNWELFWLAVAAAMAQGFGAWLAKAREDGKIEAYEFMGLLEIGLAGGMAGLGAQAGDMPESIRYLIAGGGGLLTLNAGKAAVRHGPKAAKGLAGMGLAAGKGVLGRLQAKEAVPPAAPPAAS